MNNRVILQPGISVPFRIRNAGVEDVCLAGLKGTGVCGTVPSPNLTHIRAVKTRPWKTGGMDEIRVMTKETMPDFLQILHDGSCSEKTGQRENAEKPKPASRQQVPVLQRGCRICSASAWRQYPQITPVSSVSHGSCNTGTVFPPSPGLLDRCCTCLQNYRRQH